MTSIDEKKIAALAEAREVELDIRRRAFAVAARICLNPETSLADVLPIAASIADYFRGELGEQWDAVRAIALDTALELMHDEYSVAEHAIPLARTFERWLRGLEPEGAPQVPGRINAEPTEVSASVSRGPYADLPASSQASPLGAGASLSPT